MNEQGPKQHSTGNVIAAAAAGVALTAGAAVGLDQRRQINELQAANTPELTAPDLTALPEALADKAHIQVEAEEPASPITKVSVTTLNKYMTPAAKEKSEPKEPEVSEIPVIFEGPAPIEDIPSGEVPTEDATGDEHMPPEEVMPEPPVDPGYNGLKGGITPEQEAALADYESNFFSPERHRQAVDGVLQLANAKSPFLIDRPVVEYLAGSNQIVVSWYDPNKENKLGLFSVDASSDFSWIKIHQRMNNTNPQFIEVNGPIQPVPAGVTAGHFSTNESLSFGQVVDQNFVNPSGPTSTLAIEGGLFVLKHPQPQTNEAPSPK